MHYSFHISSIFEHESCGKITCVKGSALKFHERKSFLESLQLTLCLVFIKFKRGLGPTYAIARAARIFFRIVPLKGPCLRPKNFVIICMTQKVTASEASCLKRFKVGWFD